MATGAVGVSGREHKSKSDLLLLVLSTNIARDVPSMLMRASSLALALALTLALALALALAWLLDLNTFVQSGQANLVSGPDDDICMCENWQKCQFDDLVNGQLKSTCSWTEDNGCQRLQARRLCTTTYGLLTVVFQHNLSLIGRLSSLMANQTEVANINTWHRVRQGESNRRRVCWRLVFMAN